MIGSACWSVGAPGHRGVAIAARQIRAGPPRSRQILADQLQAVAQLQHEPGVDDVLGGGAPVHVAAGIALAGLGQRLDQRHDRIAGQLGAACRIASRSKRRDVRLGGDLLGRLGRDQAEPGLSAGERRLDVEHALQARLVREHRPHRGRREQAAVDAESTGETDTFPSCSRSGSSAAPRIA